MKARNIFQDVLNNMKKPVINNPCPNCGNELRLKTPCCGNPYISTWCPICKYRAYKIEEK